MSARIAHAPERHRYELLGDDGGLLGFSDYLPRSHPEYADLVDPAMRAQFD